MAELDKQKEIIGIYKTGFFFVLGSLFAILAFMFQNYDKLNNIKLILLSAIIISGAFVLIFIVKKLKESLEKIKDLK